jgi:hypothetical protein
MPAGSTLGPRLAALGLLAAASVGLWQAAGLERWSFEGPGPGLFPLLTGGVCAVLALVVALFPGRAASADEGDEEPQGGAAASVATRRFALYALALLLLAVGPAYLGIALSAIVISVLLIRYAEGRSWRAALVYGICAALIALVGFGWLLRVDLPAGPLERAFFALVR